MSAMIAWSEEDEEGLRRMMKQSGPWVPYRELRRRRWQLRGALALLVAIAAAVLWWVLRAR